jgi:hypothetical protein
MCEAGETSGGSLHRCSSWRTKLISCTAPLVYGVGSAVAALVGWAAAEPFFQEGGCAGRIGTANAFFFPFVMGTIASFLIAVDLRNSRQRSRPVTVIPASAGFGVAFSATYLLQGPAHVLFTWLSPWIDYCHDSPPLSGGAALLAARGLAWAVMASAPGISLGLVTAGWRTACGAIMGGIVGGFAGGLVFEPAQLLLPPGSGTWGWLAHAVGMVFIGGTAGLVAGVMADIPVRGIIRILSGPLEGHETMIFLTPCLVGRRTGCPVFLEGDRAAEPAYALIQKIGFRFEIRSLTPNGDIWVNGKDVRKRTLRHGDLIRVPGTEMMFLDSSIAFRDQPSAMQDLSRTDGP